MYASVAVLSFHPAFYRSLQLWIISICGRDRG